jgi:two-component system sensor histidine kinase BaeS
LPPALGDSSLVFQAATRLMLNALAYTPPGGRVTVITRQQFHAASNWITLTVQDTGPGISAKDLPHLFERFYRGEAASDYTVPGTGLGLAISQNIIDKMGGRITVDSQPGAGAAFTIWLPVSQ